MTIKDLQREFIRDEVLSLSWQGASQRANIYGTLSEKEREAFKINARRVLTSTIVPYLEGSISPEEHINNIETLRASLENILGKPFKFGIAQKFLNLYLKYLWCLGDLADAPPHCPVDAIVLSEIGEPVPTWTSSEFDQEVYKKRIAKIRSIALQGDIPAWELEHWNQAIRNVTPAYV